MTIDDKKTEQPFSKKYSNFYDWVYQDKKYSEECDLIEKIIKNHCQLPVHYILDLGCGTGNHALELASRGYHLVGVDKSTAMLNIANKKAKQNDHRSKVTFYTGDIRDHTIDRRFEAVLMMFAVLGYQYGNDDVISALSTARKHLIEGGLLIFDVWFGPAVLNLRPSERIKVIPTNEGEIVRVTSGILDVNNHSCAVDYRIWEHKNGRVVNESVERHKMRFFFPREIQLFLSISGFNLVDYFAFPEINHRANDSTWNVLFVAKAV